MILGFKQKYHWGEPTLFREKIINGSKVHTIRQDVHNRWKPGMTIQFAVGVRTKYYEQFKEGICQSTQLIEIRRDIDYLGIVKVDGRILTESEVSTLAFNDGFWNLLAFWMWFDDRFTGKIIHWTDLKY